MIIIIMIACCYVGALGPKAELILVCAEELRNKVWLRFRDSKALNLTA